LKPLFRKSGGFFILGEKLKIAEDEK